MVSLRESRLTSWSLSVPSLIYVCEEGEKEEERRRSAPGGRAEDSISTVLDLCDLAWASQTADYSSSMSEPRQSPSGLILLAANYTHAQLRSAAQHPKPKIKRSAALAVAITPNRLVLVSFSQALAGDESSSENLCLSVRIIMI